MIKKDMTMKEFTQNVEALVEPLARENSEGSYTHAIDVVRVEYIKVGMRITPRQATKIVNSVWNRVWGDKNVD